jgi:hypothetical protein
MNWIFPDGDIVRRFGERVSGVLCAQGARAAGIAGLKKLLRFLTPTSVQNLLDDLLRLNRVYSIQR